jgi:SAM-dependent methyltransferase
MSGADHFSAVAPRYASARPTYPPQLVEFLAAVAPAHDLAWDCGCGSGQLSLPLTTRFARVVATDASTAQLAAAAAHPRVEYRCAAAETSGLAAASVDLAVAAQAAHWFDLPAYYAEVRRVAKPRACVALVAYGTGNIDDERADAVLRRFHTEVLGPHWPPERQHVEMGYRTLAFPFAEIPAPQLWIERVWRCTELLAYVETWSAVRGLERAQGAPLWADFRAEMEQAWGDPEANRRMRWPIWLRVGRV